MTEATGVYVPPVVEHSEWDRTADRIKLFAISRPATEADVAAFVPSPEYAEGMPPNVGEPFDKWYTIPAKPNVGLGLGFLRYARQVGIELAMSWLLEEAVGTEGYLALAAEPNLEPEDLAAIMKRCRDVILGGLAAPKG